MRTSGSRRARRTRNIDGLRSRKTPIFEDRREAGRHLARELADYKGSDALVLALPRGGVVVGYEVAVALHVPLEVFVSRKIGAPGNPELAIGAVAEVDGLWIDREAVQLLGVTKDYQAEEVAAQRREIERRIESYRGGGPLPSLHGRTAIVVDDGIATGYTMLAALKGVRTQGPAQLIAAVPVAPQDALWKVSTEADSVVCLATPEPFYAVGFHYLGFEQVTDEDVVRYLEMARQAVHSPHKPK